ncbi:hypothetical protein [Streptomyces sp. NPDC041003]|uniref:hypothetical protein n=1 Tax=Streptomyces sp. NPDC041003 TaxID=3155730 RepID=UPI00340E8BBC
MQQLLLQRVEYRDRWVRLARRSGASAGVSQAAVAEVIALHLWETGERPDTGTALPRTLKDRVQRALAGEVLSPQTLDWFIGAFRMNRVDGDMLRAERFHDPAGRDASLANTLREEQPLPLRQRHRTVSVFERRFIGIGGYPVRHRTTQAVEFDPGRPPSKLWWAVWDDHSGGRVLFEEQVGFEDASAVHRFLPSLENAAAGFRWTW